MTCRQLKCNETSPEWRSQFFRRSEDFDSENMKVDLGLDVLPTYSPTAQLLVSKVERLAFGPYLVIL